MAKNRRILHIASSPDFMNFTAEVFEEAAPGDNLFVGVDADLNRLSSSVTLPVENLTSSRDGRDRLTQLVAQSRIAIFHNVGSSVVEALATAPPTVLKVWSGWGTDYYGSTFDSDSGLLGPLTRQIVNRGRRPTFWAGRLIHKIQFDKLFRTAAHVTDVFSAPIPGDLRVFKRRFPGFNGQYSQLNYGSVENSLATGPDRAIGNDILVGNSSAPTNNHLDVIGFLSTLELGDRHVVVPLSYGNRDYAESVLRECRNVLGERFIPITTFMPINEYNDVLAQCGSVIMGHHRQAGLGNVLRAIWQGSRVFLDARNPIVQYLREGGISVGILDELPRAFPNERVSASEIETNRKFLDERWSRRAVMENVHALLNLA